MIFSDYYRPTIRLSALMELPVTYIFTHDSIGVGEDDPTHQPIEHLIALRAIPDLVTIRPCDANEVAEAWRYIMQSRKHPVALILSRQNLPTLDRERSTAASELQKGGYVLSDSNGEPELILLASGSEVSLCLDAQAKLVKDGVRTRVVSIASFEISEQQSHAYRLSVSPVACRRRLAVEAPSSLGWRRYVGIAPDGAVGALRHYRASAPWKDLQKKFGFTADDVVTKAKKLLAGEIVDR